MAEQLIQDWLEITQNGEETLRMEEKLISELAGSLDSGTIAFPDYIKSLTSRIEQEPDLTVAGRGLSLLPKTFVTIKNEPSRHDVHLFVPYLCARLEDGSPGIYYVAEALQIMVKWTRFAPGDAQEVARAVFKLGAANNFSSQTAITRLSLYALVDILRATRASAIKRDMSEKEFVKGLVTMAELEKNPSCLRALFKLYAILSREWTLDEGDFKQVFDSYVRYFPITMKDAPKDPKIPTTAELRDLLLKCFVASDGFAQPTFSAMVDRLDVDSANTKVEVFRTLTNAVQSYSVATISHSSNKLWDSLKFEVWNGENDQWIQSSLDLLREIAASLDRLPCEWSDKNSPVHSFIMNALGECRDRIKDKPTTYLRTSGRIFNALASATPLTFHLTSQTVIPIMDTLAQAHSNGLERTSVLEVLNGILSARLAQPDIADSLQTTSADVTPEATQYKSNGIDTMSTAFEPFKERLLEIYRDGITQLINKEQTTDELTHCLPSIQGLELLFRIPLFLSDSEKEMVVTELVQIALAADQKEDVMGQSVLALGTISGLQPQLFQTVVLPAILGMLPDQLSTIEVERRTQLAKVITLLESLVRISSTTTILEARHQNFTSLEEALLKKFAQTLPIPGQQQYQHAILASLSAWLKSNEIYLTKSTSSSPQSLKNSTPLDEFAPITFLLSHLVQKRITDQDIRIETNDSVDDVLSRFAGDYIMRSLRATSVSTSPIASWDRANPTSASAIWTLLIPINQLNFTLTQVMLIDASDSQRRANVLSMYLLAGVQSEDTAYLKTAIDTHGLATVAITNAIKSTSRTSLFSRLSNLFLLQLLVNKFGAAKSSNLATHLKSQVEDISSLTQAEAENTYQVLAYFTAAALAALDPSTSGMVQEMLDGLKHPTHGRKIAQSFRLLLAPSDIITKENACVVRPLRKGRLYQLAVVPLSRTWRTSEDPAVKQNALIALSGILAFLEPTMLADNAAELMPVLLEGTNIQGDHFAKNACIKAILDLVPLTPKMITEHLAAVIERMTDRTRNTRQSPSDSNVRGRAMALEVLLKLTDIVDKSILLKRKSGLMKELNYALEDSSSEVRSRAERCKMAWFNLTDGE